MSLNSQYKTSDLALSAALMTFGFVLREMKLTKSEKIVFVFEHRPGMDGIIQKFWSGNLMVDARTFFYSIKSLKTQLYTLTNRPTSDTSKN